VLAAPGASALIARIPALVPPGDVWVPGPTYNEHAAAFRAQGHRVVESEAGAAPVRVLVHPNNPDGRLWNDGAFATRGLTVVDESFCDVMPRASHVSHTVGDGVIVLKSFGKFWGLAGLRLGFAIGPVTLIARLAELLGPWPVSGPALRIGAAALADEHWADATRIRLDRDAARLDKMVRQRGARLAGGTALFRLYEVADAVAWQDRLARAHVWSRVFPYSRTWLRLGLPPREGWARVEAAL
jgi:cobalamin biosynthetic protein CobC